MFKIFKIFFIILLFASSSYAETIKSKSGAFYLKKVKFSDLKNWENDNVIAGVQAFLKSCDQMAKLNKNKILSKELYDIQVKDLRNVCDIAEVIAGTSSDDTRIFFESWFTPYLVIDKEEGKNGFFTGYYEPTISASETKNEEYCFPIYKRPDDLTNLPYFSREEIENGALVDKNLELFYTNDKVGLAFLQIQGSGKLKLTNGTETKITYNGKNNRDYTSISSILLQNKYMKKKEINAKSIKEWFKNNPEKIDEVLNKNESYIFFKKREDDYIRGTHGSILTPFRSIAIDYRLLPFGFPFWLETKIQENDQIFKFQKLVVSQDTGTAIRGAVRADIYFGDDEKAEELASKMKFKGKYYILLPNNIVEKIKNNK